MKKKIHINIRFILIPFVLLLFCILAGKSLLSDELEVTYTHIYSPKIKSGETIRMIVLADLHNKQFGEGNIDLINKINALNPDIIIMAGDMVNKNDSNTQIILSLCNNLKEIAPVYYGFGNHEMVMIYQNNIRLDYALEENGIFVFKNSSVETEVKGTPFLIGSIPANAEGFNEDTRFAEYLKNYLGEGDTFKLLITHFSDLYYDILANEKIDLGICGHYHGGQIQIPGLGGLYSVDYGFFPEYCSGLYKLEHGNIYVSRGLGNSRKIPRINNRPELAVLDVNSRQ